MNTGARTIGKQPAKIAIEVWENEGGSPAGAKGWVLTGLTRAHTTERAPATDRMLALPRFTAPARVKQASGQ